MSNNYDDYGYEDEKSSSGLAKKLLIVLLVVIAIVVILYLLSSCTKKEAVVTPTPSTFDYENVLLAAGQKYYENNSDLYPVAAGECTQVELQTLIDRGLVNVENFDKCNRNTTYVRVCMLENGSKQYTPWLTCTDRMSDSLYSESREGTLNDLVANSTYVDFKFIAQELNSAKQNLGKTEEYWKDQIPYSTYKTIATTPYYRYKDKLFTWNLTKKYYYTSKGEKTKVADVKEYYPTKPDSKYTLYEGKAKAYKWYTIDNKVYAMGTNGARAISATQISGYPYKELAATVTKYQTRTVTGTYAPIVWYACSTSASSTTIVYQAETKCGKGSNSTYTYQRDVIFSCARANSTNDKPLEMKVNSASDTCYSYSAWGAATDKVCTESPTCRKASVNFYYWYKLGTGGQKVYWPSNQSDVNKEKVYYTEAPVAGAQKDTTTETDAYKWYREEKKTSTEYTAVAPSGYTTASRTENYKWSDWSSWSTKNPKTSDGRVRTIETKYKIKLQQILGTSEDSWNTLSTMPLTEQELINVFKEKKYNVNNLTDINNNGQIRYQIKMYIRNKKEALQ